MSKLDCDILWLLLKNITCVNGNISIQLINQRYKVVIHGGGGGKGPPIYQFPWLYSVSNLLYIGTVNTLCLTGCLCLTLPAWILFVLVCLVWYLNCSQGPWKSGEVTFALLSISSTLFVYAFLPELPYKWIPSNLPVLVCLYLASLIAPLHSMLCSPTALE